MRWGSYWAPGPRGMALRLPAAGGVGAVVTDPLADLSDDFSTAGSLTDRGFTVFNPSVIATSTVSGGALTLTGTVGGAGGAHWYSQPGVNRAGAIAYKLVTGDFDVRARCRVTNLAGTDVPPNAGGEWRFAGIQVQEPAGLGSTVYNYVHLGLGSDPNGARRIEWKVTDSGGAVSPYSTYGSDAGSGATELAYDLRIVRVGQLFYLYYRLISAGEALASDLLWSAISVSPISKDTNSPARFGGTTPVAFSSELAVGIMPPYAGPQASIDIRLVVEEILYSTP